MKQTGLTLKEVLKILYLLKFSVLSFCIDLMSDMMPDSLLYILVPMIFSVY